MWKSRGKRESTTGYRSERSSDRQGHAINLNQRQEDEKTSSDDKNGDGNKARREREEKPINAAR